MANIITKSLGSTAKNNVLTNAELDNNFINLNEELITKINYDAVEYPSLTEKLHRSPNTISSMFIYDTSKDSDGGAWTDKCQNTSWYNEPINGNWLGACETEGVARAKGGTLGPELLSNPGNPFTNTDGYVYFLNDPLIYDETASIVDGKLRVTQNILPAINYLSFTITGLSVGKTYLFTSFGATSSAHTAPGIYIVGSSIILVTFFNSSIDNRPQESASFVANATTVYVRLLPGYHVNNATIDYNGFSLKEVLTQANSGDYYQLISDGKFYKPSRNILTYSEDFTNPIWDGMLPVNQVTEVANPLGIFSCGKVTYTSETFSTFRRTNYYYYTDEPYTFSVYVKKGNWRYVGLRMSNLNIGYKYAFFDFDTQTTSTIGISGVTLNYESANNGWYRLILSGITPAFYSVIDIAMTSSNGDTSTGVTSGSYLYFWGVQLELGTIATTYEKTDSKEVFRGNKREFPKLSAIITESTNVTIYDLTEKNNPMWMRFVIKSAPGSSIGYHGSISCCSALSGIMLIGHNHIGGHVDTLHSIEFIKDFSVTSAYSVNVASYPTFVGRNYNNIAKRNSTFIGNGFGGYSFSGYNVESISMAILPNAPTDPITGLKVPTIALAGNASVHIITNKGTLLTGATAQSYTRVILTPRRLYLTRGTLSTAFYYADNPANLANGFAVTSSTGTESNTDTISNYVINKNKMGKIGNYKRELQLALLNDKSLAKSCFANIGQSFNTGYEIGDIRRSYLSSNVTSTSFSEGENLITNGNFDVDISGWTETSANVIHEDGKIKVTNIGAVYGKIYQTIPTEIGKSYKLSVNFVSGTALPSIWASTNSGTGNSLNYVYVLNAGVYTIYFTAIDIITYILLINNSASDVYSYYDNISVVECERDYSYKAKGANIYGSLTKTAVNTGSDLVQYSGFSNSNYIRESHSSELDFGLLEFNISSWVNIPINNTNAGTICSRAYPSGPTITLSNNSSNNLVATLYDGTTTKTVTTSAAYNTGTPIKASASYKFGKLGISVNGKEVATNLGLPLKALSGAWEEKAGQLNSQTYIRSLAVFNNGSGDKLYGGTLPNGKLFEWNGSNAWIEVAPQLAGQTYVNSLAVFNGGSGDKLYGGTAPGGKLFEWNGSNAWVEVAPQLGAETYVNSLAVFNGGSGDKLYGGTYPNGKLFEWNGSNAWVEVAPQLASQTYIFSLAVFNNGSGDKLYGGTYPNGKLFEWNGSNAWIEVAPQLAGQTHIYSLAVFNNGSGDKLYGGTAPGGKLFEWNGSNAWVEVAPQLASQTYIFSLAVFNNGSGDKLYGGTMPNGKLFEWNGYGTNSTLTIGNNADLNTPFPGSLSLLKLSGTVPTKEQELFMYEQEKQLFNPNTKCVLPDSATVMYDVSYDNYNDKFLLNSSLNMSEWNGLVRTNNIPISIGTYHTNESKNGIKLIAQQSGNTGADIIKPNYNIKKKVSEKDSYSKSITFPVELVDYIGGFTGTTVLNSNVITSNDIPTYDIIGTTITGTGIPANTTILDISGTSIYIDTLATAAGSVNISFLDYNLPIGYTTKYIVKNGVYLTEGATKDYTILYDGFRETIKLVATPNYQDWIQLQITKDK